MLLRSVVSFNKCRTMDTKMANKEKEQDVSESSVVKVKMLYEVKRNTLQNSHIEIQDYLQNTSGNSSLPSFTSLTENLPFCYSNLSEIEPMSFTTENQSPHIYEEKENKNLLEKRKIKKTNYRQFFSRDDDYNDEADGDFSPTDGSDYDPIEDINYNSQINTSKRPRSLNSTHFLVPNRKKNLKNYIKDLGDDIHENSTPKNEIQTNIPEDPNVAQQNYSHRPETNLEPNIRSRKNTRVWNRKNYCIYCDQLVTNFSRHILRKHSKEKEVLEYISITEPDPKILKLKRQKITDGLRNRGNFKHNSRVAFDREGDILPRKRNTSLSNSPSNYVTCKICLGTFKRSTFYRHFKTCGEHALKENDLPDSYKHRVVRNNAICLVSNTETASQELKDTILPRLRTDHISLIAKTDPLIVAFASRLLKKKKEKRSRKAICSRMRDLATLLSITREKDKEIDSLTSMIDPCKYEIFIKAVKSMCGFNEETGFVNVTSIPSRIRPAILGCIDILYTQTIMSDDSSAYKDAYKKKLEDFKQLLEINWQWEISSNAEKTRKRLNMTKENVLPLDEDIETVTKKIHELEEKYSRKLNKDVNVMDYEILCVVTIAHIILLDRKRAGDAAEAELTFYINRKNEEMPKKILQSLTSSQRQCIDDLEVFQIPGKRTRSVPILLTKVMRENIDLIVSCRSVLNIPHTNPYLFARPMSSEPFDGGKCLDKIKKMCYLKKPEMLISTGMRHHIATMSQIDAKQNDYYTEQLAGFLGHDMAVHSKNYRLPLQILQKAVVGSKLIEYETSEYSNENKDANVLETKQYKKKQRCETIVSNEIQTIESANQEEEKIAGCSVEGEADDRNFEFENDDSLEDTISINGIKVNTKVILPKKSEGSSVKSEFKNKAESGKISVDNETETDSSYETADVTKKKICRRKKTHVSWTDAEIKLVKKHFKKNIENKINPGKALCTEVLKKEPLLRKRTWMQLNTYVNNIYKKTKR